MIDPHTNGKRIPEGDAGKDGKKRKRKLFGFPKEASIKLKREFDAVFNSGSKCVDDGLVIYAMRNGRSGNRLGLVVGKKVGNAVRRNRVRRLLREAFRLQQSPSPLPGGFDLVCIPRIRAFPGELSELIPVFRRTAQRAIRRCENRR